MNKLSLSILQVIVFSDGLNKTDKKEGLLKRLKDIESKSNNQLLALKNINKPAIRGRDDDDDDDGGGGDDDDYKKIVNKYINNEIDYKSIEEDLNKINKRIGIYEKNKETLKKIPMYKNQVDKDKKDAKVLKRIINEILLNKIIQKNITKKIIDILWIDDTKLFNQINNDIAKRYHEDRDSTELLSIQNFLDAINNEDITNKDDARKEFIKLKKKLLKVIN